MLVVALNVNFLPQIVMFITLQDALQLATTRRAFHPVGAAIAPRLTEPNQTNWTRQCSHHA